MWCLSPILCFWTIWAHLLNLFFGGGRVDEQPQNFGCGLLQKERVEQIDLHVSFITLRMLKNTEILHLSVKKTPFHAGFVDDALLIALNDYSHKPSEMKLDVTVCVCVCVPMFPDHLLDAHSAQDRKTRLSAIMTPVKEIFTGGCGFSKVLLWSYLSTMSF